MPRRLLYLSGADLPDRKALLLLRHKRCSIVDGKLMSRFGPGSALRKWMLAEDRRKAFAYVFSVSTTRWPDHIQLRSWGATRVGDFTSV